MVACAGWQEGTFNIQCRTVSEGFARCRCGICRTAAKSSTTRHPPFFAAPGLRVQGGGWRVEGGGWWVEGEGWRVEGRGRGSGVGAEV